MTRNANFEDRSSNAPDLEKPDAIPRRPFQGGYMLRHITFYLIALFIAFGGEHIELHATRNHARRVHAHAAR